MEFCVLGPLVVRRDAAVIPVRPGRQRAVLAALLLNANRVVSLDDLAEVLWGDTPPPSVRVTLQNYVVRLRKALPDADGSRIVTQARGYLIRVHPGELDIARFRARMDAARTAARDGAWDQALAEAHAALAIWRDEPLADVDSDVLAAREVPRLAEMRLQALEARIEADLHLGRHREVISELRHLADSHPLRERLHGQLMLALYRDGRQGEALAAYQHARQLLIDEFGAEPGTGLRDLHQQILTADPALAAEPGPAPPSAAPRPVVPRELPAQVRHFTGREGELAALTRLLDQGLQDASATVVIGGTAGVGKTALAVRWAHQAAGRFPDGQLYVNLRGYDPGQPIPAADALAGFLRSLGVPGQDIPPGEGERAARYRSLLAGKKMLIVLDNACEEQQVRPLLPASPASLVIVTSRNQLAGLAAAEGARLLSLDVLNHDEAVHMLTARIGSTRAVAEPEATDEIARLCAHLPLALAVAAAGTVARPGFPLAPLATELQDASARLEALDAGDPAVSVRAVFSWSCRHLSEQAALMFRLLSLHPGPDISVPAAASLAAVDQSQARRLLRELARGCLITEHAPGRYAFHDLLRAYAASQARDIDGQPDRDAAIGRVLDHYLHTANRAVLLGRPTREPVTIAPPRPGTCPERPADHRQALAWYEAERQVLLAAVTLAAETGADHHAWQLPYAMAAYLFWQGYSHELATVMGTALAAATRLGDAPGQAMSSHGLGSAYTSTGDYDQARAHLERSLSLYQRLGDGIREAWTQQSLAYLAKLQGRYADALGHNEQALRLLQAIGHEAAKAELLGDIAWDCALLGNYQRARAFCEQSLALIAKLGGREFEHTVWDALGYIEFHLGNFARAAVHLESALGLCRDHGDRLNEAQILAHLGDVRHAVGELPQAREAWLQALAIFDDIQHPDAGNVRAKLAGPENAFNSQRLPGRGALTGAG